MASMIISTYMMFLPQRTVFFCIIVLAVGFFGIFLPYQERRKKKQQTKKSAAKKPDAPKPAAGPPADKKRLEQLETLRKAGMLSEEEYQEKKKEIRRR